MPGHAPDKKSQGETIRVDESAAASQVLFTTLNEDRFVLSCAQAVAAVTLGLGANAIREEILGLLDHATKQFRQHRSQIRSVHAMLRQAELVFFVVPAKDTYDSDLGEKLSDIDIDLARLFQIVPSGVQQIPAESMSMFINETAWELPIHEHAEYPP